MYMPALDVSRRSDRDDAIAAKKSAHREKLLAEKLELGDTAYREAQAKQKARNKGRQAKPGGRRH